MTVKITFLVLLLTGATAWAQMPAPPAAEKATPEQEALRELLRRSMSGETNAAGPEMQGAEPETNSVQPATDESAAPAGPPPMSVPAPAAAPAEPAANEAGPPAIQQPAQGPPPMAIPGASANPPPADNQSEEIIPAGQINFSAAELDQVLTLYAQWVNRTILRAPNLPNPTIQLKSQTPLTKSEAIQALDAVLSLNGIAMIPIGDKFVKAVPLAQADFEGAATDTRSAEQLPNLGQYVTHIVQLQYAKPSELVPVLQAFSKSKSIMAVDSSGILVIRDYAENVKRMLDMVHRIDVSEQSAIISEVIPIKYALASDIATALNSVSGSGSSGTTVGASSASGLSNFRGSTTGLPGTTGNQLNRPGVTTPAGTPSSTSSFSDRLRAIIHRASTPSGGGGEFQILGATKIIADERTNSLLVFASKQDMAMIKDIVSKLDVVLAQVLIEAIIMEVSLDNSYSLGLSYLQHPQQSGQFTGVGAIKNTSSFLSPGNFGNAITNGLDSLGSGFSYWARAGDSLDMTATAIAGNNEVNVLSRPSIQTSHAVPAQLFIGDTVPYIQGTTYGDFVGSTSRSVYQEKEVGISLNVLPLINPDGLVVMDIQQDISQLGTPVTIDGNSVPTTTKRSASAKVAVKDGDTIILGGLISSTKSKSKSGVPLLKDIPLLGYLFRSTTDSNKRTELVVLMSPTVLPTPEAAAITARKKQDAMPAVRQAEAEFKADQQKEIKLYHRKFGDQ